MTMGAGLTADFLYELASPIVVAAQTLIATWLFCRGNEPRPRHRARAALVVAGAAVLVLAGVMASFHLNSLGNRAALVSQASTFCVVPTLLVVTILFCRRMSPWVALFYAAAIQIMQNLTSGLEGCARIALTLPGNGLEGAAVTLSLGIVATALVYTVCNAAFIRRITREGLSDIEDRGMMLVVLVVVIVAVGFDLAIKELALYGVPRGHLIALRLIHGVICAFILFCQYEMLYSKRLSAEVAETERMLVDAQRHYELSRANIEAINLKCHDLKHQIRELRQGGAVVSNDALDELEQAVGIYDAALHTGNEALDVILTEKALVCERENITLSVIADGKALSFMTAADLYSLFGNALDNAIEAVSSIPDCGRRSISLTVRERAGVVVVHTENYCRAPVTFNDGLPQTCKRDGSGRPDTFNHGYGTRSMRLICERYGGMFECRAEDGVYHLNALLPLPTEAGQP